MANTIIIIKQENNEWRIVKDRIHISYRYHMRPYCNLKTAFIRCDLLIWHRSLNLAATPTSNLVKSINFRSQTGKCEGRDPNE